jgi:hypothetical protein
MAFCRIQNQLEEGGNYSNLRGGELLFDFKEGNQVERKIPAAQLDYDNAQHFLLPSSLIHFQPNF